MSNQGVQLFCQEHWKELIPDIEAGDLNGIALQPLAMQGLLAHEAVQEEFDDIIGAHDHDVEEVVAVASPACCYLEGLTNYSEGSEFADDYQILLAMGAHPLDEEPEEWWVDV